MYTMKKTKPSTKEVKFSRITFHVRDTKPTLKSSADFEAEDKEAAEDKELSDAVRGFLKWGSCNLVSPEIQKACWAPVLWLWSRRIRSSKYK